MKTLLLIITLLLSVACKAQTPVVSLNTLYGDAPTGAYYKDLAHQLDPYEGTWLSEENGNVFSLVLQKVEQVYTVRYYEDMIIGGYIYSENGVELVNTLADLNDTTIVGDDHLISGNSIISCYIFPNPGDCQPHTTKLRVFIEDPNRPDLTNFYMTLRPITVNVSGVDVAALQGIIYDRVSVMSPTGETNLSVPNGEYTLIKQ